LAETPSGDHERSTGDSDDLKSKMMGFLDHLEELRVRLLRAFLILVIGTAVCLVFSERLIGFLTRWFEPGRGSLALLYPTEGFVVRLKTALVAGIFLTSPFWFAQVWGFISPGLYRDEKRVVVPVVFTCSGAFLLGAAFGYRILPIAINYFQSLTTPGVEVTWSLGRYIDFSLRLLLAFGLVFELPLIIYAAAQLGIVTPRVLRNYRRHAIIGILVVSAVITPPDIFTQIVLAVPLIALYEAGILTAVLAERKQRRRKAER